MDDMLQTCTDEEGTMPIAEVTLPQLASHDSLVASTIYFEGSWWSKAMLLNQLEKVEFEIDLTKKELAKLENDSCRREIVSYEILPGVGNARQPVGGLPTAVDQRACADKVSSASESSQPTEGNWVSGKVTRIVEVERLTMGCTSEIDEEDRKLKSMINSVKGEMESLKWDYGNDFQNAGISRSCKATMTLTPWDCKNYDNMVLSLVATNQEIAKHSFDPLCHLLPSSFLTGGKKPYNIPEDITIWQCNSESHEWHKGYLQEKIAMGKRLLTFKELVLVLKYRSQREAWKQNQHKHSIGQHRDHMRILREWELDFQNSDISLSQQSALQLCPIASGSARSETAVKEIQIMMKLLNESFGCHQRAYLRMPAMILDKEARKLVVTSHGLVKDPVALEEERKLINPWTADEKKIFLEMFCAIGKNFSKIALYLEHKTSADCVEFYYRNKKLGEFKKVRRQQLRKHKICYRTRSYRASVSSVNG